MRENPIMIFFLVCISIVSFQIVEDAPYITQLETLDEYNIDFVVHGGIVPWFENIYNTII